MEVVSSDQFSPTADVSTKTALFSTTIQGGCVPPFASQDMEKVTMISMETSTNKQVVFRLGWTAATDRAKRHFDRLISALSCDKCGEKRAEEEIVQYGLCDHHICRGCLLADQEMYPGVAYCSHEDCLQHIPQESVLNSTSSCSASSLPIVTMVLLKIFLFNNSNRPSHWQMEVKGSTPVSQILDWVHWQTDSDVSKHKVYFSSKKEVHRRHLKPMENKEERIARLHTENLNIVLVAPGVSMGGCF